MDVDSKLIAGYLNSRGLAYADQGDFDRAITDFDEAIRRRPYWSYGYFNRGNAYARKGDLQRAVEDLQRAAKLTPISDPWHRRVTDRISEIEKEVGVGSSVEDDPACFSQEADHSLAIRDCTELITKFTTTHSVGIFTDFFLWLLYDSRGRAYARGGDIDRSIADFTEALRVIPEDYRSRFNRGVSFYTKGDYDRAIIDFDNVIQLSSDDAKHYYWRGMAYEANNDATTGGCRLQSRSETVVRQ